MLIDLRRTVILGAKTDLHDGVHGALIDDPPGEVEYSVRDALHLFTFPQGNGTSPHRCFHLAECVDFGPGPELVHTARWPAINRRAWVADMDDFGYPVLIGRAVVNPDVRRKLCQPSKANDDVNVGRRAANMLRMYAHPSCKGVIFRTHHGLDLAREQLLKMGAGTNGDTFLKKASVLYPAQRAATAHDVEHKWNGTRTLQVVFCGRDHETKNGPMALRIFRQLATEMPAVRFLYLGEPPADSELVAIPDVEILGVRPRHEVLDLFASSHVLFHPSKFESVGIVLLEAAAAGMAIVAARGGEMRHMQELFGDGGAALLDRDSLAVENEEEWFCRELRRLIHAPAAAAAMARHNHRKSTSGVFSIAHRNKLLSSVYAMAESTTSEPLSISELATSQERLVALDSRDVLADQVTFLHGIGVTRQHVNILA